jgi:hypothetical protein
MAWLPPAVRAVELPGASRVAAFNAQMAALKVVQQVTGLDPIHPQTATRVADLLRSLETNGIGDALRAAPLGPREEEGLTRLRRFHSCRQSIRDSLQFDVLDRDAAGKLTHAVEKLRMAVRASRPETSAPPEVIAALARLAALGTALSPWGRRRW